METTGESEAPHAQWRPSASTAALRARADALAKIRTFFAAKNVLEVQTPLLGQATVTDPSIEAFRVSAPNPRSARSDTPPPATHVGYLQTSSEYHQKRLLAAGVGDNYTLASVFRADEQGRLHNPEFTMLEWYRLGFDERALMAEVSELVDLLLGAGTYQTHRYSVLLERVELSADERRDIDKADQNDLRVARAVESLGAGRHFVIDYPADAAVLARLDPLDSSIARRFELVVDGVEIANGYFELNEVSVHRERFEQDNQVRSNRALPAVAADEALLGAIAEGLPDCSGVALGFDRLLMLKLGAQSLSEVQAFGWDQR